MKYLFIITKSYTIFTFRYRLIKSLQKNGDSVVVIASDDERKDDAIKENIEFYCIKQDNRSINPFAILRYKKNMTTLIKKINPDCVFTFQLKPNVVGPIAAHKAKVQNIYAMVEGVGDVFINKSLKYKIIKKIVCCMYKKGFKHVRKVFFLNNSDLNDFCELGILNKNKAIIIHGIGVDLEKFKYEKIENYKSFIMVSRMLVNKGIFEYCDLAREVKKIDNTIMFYYLGPEGNVKLADIQKYIDDGSINYLGKTNDVRPYLEKSTCLVLLSYREGMPMSIMEAEAMGRPIITTNSVGCNETVMDGYNGYIVDVHDIDTAVKKVLALANDCKLVERMSINSRKFAEENFDSEKINKTILKYLTFERRD